MSTIDEHDMEDIDGDGYPHGEDDPEEGIPDPELREVDDTADPPDDAETEQAQAALDEALDAESAETAAVVADAVAPPLEPVRRFKRVLVCKMYPEELAKRAVALADAITDHDAYEAEKKSVAADMASVLAAKWEEVKRLSRVVHAGGEEREVDCEIFRNDREGSMETVRLDTGEVIDRRAQDVEERQLPLGAVVSPPEVPAEGAAEDRETRTQCATTRDGEQCEGVCEGDAAYCPECIADAVARDDAAEAERAKAAPRCKARVARGDNTEARCEEEAGESGFCGQHAEPCAAQGCTEPAMGAGLFCAAHSETVAKKRGRGRKGAAASV